MPHALHASFYLLPENPREQVQSPRFTDEETETQRLASTLGSARGSRSGPPEFTAQSGYGVSVRTGVPPEGELSPPSDWELPGGGNVSSPGLGAP